MYTATAIFDNCEIGYGEGEGDAYAVEECMDSIDSFYRHASPHDIRIVVRDNSGVCYSCTLAKYLTAIN